MTEKEIRKFLSSYNKGSYAFMVWNAGPAITCGSYKLHVLYQSRVRFNINYGHIKTVKIKNLIDTAVSEDEVKAARIAYDKVCKENFGRYKNLMAPKLPLLQEKETAIKLGTTICKKEKSGRKFPFCHDKTYTSLLYKGDKPEGEAASLQVFPAWSLSMTGETFHSDGPETIYLAEKDGKLKRYIPKPWEEAVFEAEKKKARELAKKKPARDSETFIINLKDIVSISYKKIY